MDRPTLNISSTGVVPMKENSQFAVIFPCTGIAEGEIDFLLQVNDAQSSLSLTLPQVANHQLTSYEGLNDLTK